MTEVPDITMLQPNFAWLSICMVMVSNIEPVVASLLACSSRFSTRYTRYNTLILPHYCSLLNQI